MSSCTTQASNDIIPRISFAVDQLNCACTCTYPAKCFLGAMSNPKEKVRDRHALGWKLYSFQKLFCLCLFLSYCAILAIEFHCDNTPFKMLFRSISVLVSVLSVSQAQLYPGQSNLNHTCQLRTAPFLLQLRYQTHIQYRNPILVLFGKCVSQRNGFLLYRNVWRSRTQHTVLGYLHRSRISRPSPS